MKPKPKVIELIQAAAEETSEELAATIQARGDKAALFGPDSVLDSLGLVSLIVAVESAVEDEFDVSVTLADERAMSQENSPFRTVDALAEYVTQLLEEEDAISRE